MLLVFAIRRKNVTALKQVLRIEAVFPEGLLAGPNTLGKRVTRGI